MDNLEVLLKDHAVSEEALWHAVTQAPIAEDLLDLLFAHPQLSDRIMNRYFTGDLVDDDTVGERDTDDRTIWGDMHLALGLPDLSDGTRLAIISSLIGNTGDGITFVEEEGVIFEHGSCLLDVCYESLSSPPIPALFEFQEIGEDVVTKLTRFREVMLELITVIESSAVGEKENLDYWSGIYPACTFMNPWIVRVEACLLNAETATR